MSPTPKTLVFDLDGTLVDSARDLVPILNQTVSNDGIPATSIDEAGSVVGQGALKMIERVFELNNRPLNQTRKKQLLSEFLVNYEANIAEHTIFYEGALEALSTLKSEGWTFAICTNKFEHLAKALIGELGQLEMFPTITGGDTFEFRKPDPAHIRETVKQAGGKPERSIVVGDSINDVQAAQNANIPVIAVDFGYSDIPVAQLNPTAIISHFSELPKAVLNIWNGMQQVSIDEQQA